MADKTVRSYALRSLKEKVFDRMPEYNPDIHVVLINNEPIESLDASSMLLDVISVQKKTASQIKS